MSFNLKMVIKTSYLGLQKSDLRKNPKSLLFLLELNYMIK
ncbi:hypothetical protein HJ01_00625 [Flavobacterium frigoris PS1]|uniref:Uncharacterized protein n=1 Tax=Flavobacterium frigoris (strain PS1) TaxID=1086011 RepID=H7FNF4_FLAFP|nr:hypothetical protein HJ01_00625 [Flavobacterium frigoris PS1]